jgi:hypothetical protein
VLHANAVLTPRQRLRLARLVVEDDWPKSRVAEFFGVSWKTADAGRSATGSTTTQAGFLGVLPFWVTIKAADRVPPSRGVPTRWIGQHALAVRSTRLDVPCPSAHPRTVPTDSSPAKVS